MATLVMASAAMITVSAAITFTATFKSIDAGRVSFFGKKVAALVMSNDESLRVSGEEALVRELNVRGIQGVATYRIAPKEELRQPETAKPWFDKANIEGVVVVRPVSAETRQAYTPATWVGTNYGTFWGYYGYGWGAVYVPGSTHRETVVVVETTVYSLTLNQLVWATVTESKDPDDLRGFVQELVKESVKEMQKQGLAKKQIK
jgi:hypothetical protein